MRALSVVPRASRGIWFIALACGLGACAKTPEPDSSGAPRPSEPARTAATLAARPTAAPTTAAKTGPADIVWEAPAGWEKADNPSPMRKATYRIPKVAGDADDAEMSVSQAGGSVDANVQRWTGQFEKAKEDATKRSEKEVNGLKVTIVELHGTFAGGGMPGMAPTAPKPNYAMLAAIVETSGTNYFFKLTGPEKTVMAARPSFDKLVDSFKAK